MKSLFRSIRHKLLGEGKLLRYATYAVGEIILIIVGILIALKISDWNEDQKSQAEFDAYIVQLKEDVKAAIGDAQRVEAFTKNASPANYSVIQFLDDDPENDPSLDAFENALVRLTRWTPLKIHVGQLGRLLSGDVETISRYPSLANKALDMQGEINGLLTLIDERREGRLNFAQIVVRYITYPNPLVPEIEFGYNLEELRSSEEFRFAVHRLSHNKYLYNVFLNGIIENLEEFLAELEEYESL